MKEKIVEKLLDSAPLTIIIIGIIVFIVGAAGGLPIGDPPLQVTDSTWRLALGLMGGVLVIIGVMLIIREQNGVSKYSGSNKNVNAKVSSKYQSEDPKLSNLIPDLSRKFKIVKLPVYQPNKIFGVWHAPLGLLLIHQVPFFFEPGFDTNNNITGHCTINLQPSKDNMEQVETIFAKINQVTKVHFMLAAGHGWTEQQGIQFLGKQIGCIELEFEDENQTTKIILGQQIREWAFGNAPTLVRHISDKNTKPAWFSYDSHYLIDMFTVIVENGPKNLTGIKIIAKFEVTSEKLTSYPAIIINAITCERAEMQSK